MMIIAPGAAAGIMLPILCVMDVLGLRAYRGKWDWQSVKHMMLPAILGIVIGALSFGSLSVNTARRCSAASRLRSRSTS